MNLDSEHLISLKGRIGLIAGNGTFPLDFVEKANEQGAKVFVIAHKGETSEEIEKNAEKVLWVKVGELGKILNFFQQERVEQAALAGGIRRPKLFGGTKPDLKALALIAKLRSVHDDVLLRGIAGEIEKLGIEIIAATALLDDKVPYAGTLTKRGLTALEKKNASIGFKSAQTLGALDIGQCVVVNEEVVVALEAVEGTDATILRAGELSGNGSVVVKLAKPQQDLRLDLPAIGPKTIENMKNAGATALVLAERQALLLDKDEILRLADDAGIAICVVSKLEDLS